jgi:Ca2+-binding EF-hand superfamily protein
VVDYDKDGSISYEEFAPLCFEILVEMLKDELMASEHTPSKLEEWLSQVFHQADPNNSGKLEANAMGQLLRSADFGMTRLQIHAVLAEADQDDQGFVDIDKFVPVAAEMLFRLKDPNSELAKAQAIQALSERGLG